MTATLLVLAMTMAPADASARVDAPPPPSTVAVEDILLPHLEAKSVDLRLAFRGASLLTGWIVNDRSFEDPKVDGWFQSEDVGSVEGRILRVEGRPADFIKIGGESVDLRRLDAILLERTTVHPIPPDEFAVEAYVRKDI